MKAPSGDTATPSQGRAVPVLRCFQLLLRRTGPQLTGSTSHLSPSSFLGFCLVGFFPTAALFVTLNSLHNLKLLHCFRELAAILHHIIMLKSLSNASLLVKPQNPILLLVSIHSDLIPCCHGVCPSHCYLQTLQETILTSSRLLLPGILILAPAGFVYFINSIQVAKPTYRKIHLTGDLC